MASSLTTTPSLRLNCSTRLTHPKLSGSRPLKFFPAPPIQIRNPRLRSFPQRQINPRVEAKKQSFSSFDELLENSDKPVLVDFYATWCGPCQLMVPVLNEVSQSLKDKIRVVKIDTEKYPSIANCYNVEALPTLIFFRDGKPCDRFEGALPAAQLIQRIENALKVAK